MTWRAARAGIFALALGLICGACSPSSEAPSKELVLPSGERVTISDAHGDRFTDVSGVKRHIYYVSFETDHDIDDIPAVRMESVRVWAAYLPEVVGDDFDTMVVTPMAKDAGGDQEGRPYYFKRIASGRWALQN